MGQLFKEAVSKELHKTLRALSSYGEGYPELLESVREVALRIFPKARELTDSPNENYQEGIDLLHSLIDQAFGTDGGSSRCESLIVSEWIPGWTVGIMPPPGQVLKAADSIQKLSQVKIAVNAPVFKAHSRTKAVKAFLQTVKPAQQQRIVGLFEKVVKNPVNGQSTLFNFKGASAKHLHNRGRVVPMHILEGVVQSPMAILKDPKNSSNAMMCYSRIWKNGKLYNIEVLYDKAANTILHFRYTHKAIGSLEKTPKPPN